ncbi:hypothetical protein F5141DRAFT_288762 [Pisolithus sp. B1]|nr:hypothetical protein F5141DRAFT_288762 [Pisolithus sp. B1]
MADGVPLCYSRMSFDNEWVLEHYHSSIANSTYDTLGYVVQRTPTTATRVNRYASCPFTLCLYTDPNGGECWEPINCGSASAHFSDVHGIVNLAREVQLVCMWQGCGSGVSRHNYIRHVREHHLGHGRIVAHADQVIRLGGSEGMYRVPFHGVFQSGAT